MLAELFFFWRHSARPISQEELLLHLALNLGSILFVVVLITVWRRFYHSRS